MPKPVSPLVGYNNNVRHKGRIFHVQTEDSGVNRPRIITHLFADGGRIVKSTRTDYSEHIGRDDLAQVVRGLMKEQHKAMFIALRDGQFDEAIAALGEAADGLGKAPPSRASEPPKPRKSAPTIPEMAVPKDVAVSSVPSDGGADAPGPQPVQRRPAPTLQGLSLAEIGAPPGKDVSPVATAVAERSPTGHTPKHGTPAVSAPGRAGEARYGAPRPAAIFEQPESKEGSLFGSATVTEQSLDEVILSYLAEDLDTGSDGG